jgi:hypothetical protein
MRGLTAGFPTMPKGMLHKRNLVDWVAGHAAKVAPLVTWLATNVKK